MINDTEEIVNKFNEFFINIGPNLINNVSRVSHETHHKYLTRNILTSFNFSLVDENHIVKTLASLRTKNSSGHDGISTKLLKIYIPGSTEASHYRDKPVSNYRNISWLVVSSQSYSIV